MNKVTSKDITTVDAVDYIMDNVFDWDGQARHAGLRMTYHDCKNLTQSLKKNLRATCPDVEGAELLELYADLVHNNWLGEINDLRLMTERVVCAYMEAEQGNDMHMVALTREMKGKVEFMEAHYSAVGHSTSPPLHAAAEAMEGNEKAGARHDAESLSHTLNQARTIVKDGGQGRENKLAKRRFPGLMRLIGR